MLAHLRVVAPDVAYKLRVKISINGRANGSHIPLYAQAEATQNIDELLDEVYDLQCKQISTYDGTRVCGIYFSGSNKFLLPRPSTFGIIAKTGFDLCIQQRCFELQTTKSH